MPLVAAYCALLVSLTLGVPSAPGVGRASRGPESVRVLHSGDTDSVSSQAQTSAASQPAEAAVKDLVARYNAARGQQDAAALAALFTEDADQLVSSGEWRRGRAALVRGMLQSSQTSPGDRTITIDTVRFLGPNMALADARYEIAGSRGADARRMWSAFVLVETPEGWRIAAIRNMLPAR